MGKILKYWPKEEIIKGLKNLPADRPINKKTLSEYSKKGLICDPSLIPNKFGSLKNACEEAGVRCDALYGKEKVNYMKQINTKYTKNKLKEILQNAFKKYGKMTPTDFILTINRENNCDIRGAINKYYGTISAALKDAEIEYNNYYWTNRRIIDTLRELNKKYGPLYKIQISEFRRKKLICGAKLIRDRFGTIENAARVAGFSFVEPKDVGHLFNGKIGQSESEVLNNIEDQYDIKLLRQFRVIIDNTVYFIDGYDNINNVAYEVDDGYHKYDKQKLLDKLRDQKIINHLICQIIHIKNY